MEYDRGHGQEVIVMSRISVVWVVLAGIGSLIIGILVTAVMNLIVPGVNLTWTLIAVCLSSLLSGIGGSILGARQKRKEASPPQRA
jgi:hypothetical protein